MFLGLIYYRALAIKSSYKFPTNMKQKFSQRVHVGKGVTMLRLNNSHKCDAKYVVTFTSRQ